jgi:hypothetical protein
VDSLTTFTQTCAFTYATLETASGSTDNGNSRISTFGSTSHTPFGTHTVTNQTSEATLYSSSSLTTTGECDYGVNSTQSTTYSSNYGTYSQYISYTTTHDTVGNFVHTISGSTNDSVTSTTVSTLSETLVSESTQLVTITEYSSITATSHTWATFSDSEVLTVNGWLGITTDTATLSSTYYDVAKTSRTMSLLRTGYFWQSITFTVTSGVETGYIRETWVSTEIAYSAYDNTSSSNITAYTSGLVSNTSSYSQVWTSSSELTTVLVNHATFAYKDGNSKAYSTSSSSASLATSFGSFSSYVTNISSTYTTQTSSSAGDARSQTQTTTENFALGNRTIQNQLVTYSIPVLSVVSTSTFTTSQSITANRGATVTTTSSRSAYTYGATGSFSISKRINWVTVWVRDDGEVLVVPTVTDTGTFRISDAAYTTTIHENSAYTTQTTSASTFQNSSYTGSSGSTGTAYLTPYTHTMSSASLSMDPNNDTLYETIENVIDRAEVLGNDDKIAFSVQAYNISNSTFGQYVSYGSGAFDATYLSTSAQYNYAASVISLAAAEDRKIHPRRTISVATSASVGTPELGAPIPYVTSSMVRYI